MSPTAIPPFRAAALGLVALLVTACGGAGPTPPASPAASAPEASASAPAPSDAPSSPSAGPGDSGSPSTPAGLDLTTPVALEEVAQGLDQPIVVEAAGDGSGRLYVAEQPGRVRVVQDGAVLDTVFVDITDRVSAGGERGLLGMALVPGFGPADPRVFIHYSGDEGQTVVSEFRLAAADDPTVLDPASERIVFTEPQPYANHNGGWIGFDPTGMLLIALGDGGAGGDPENRASDLGEPLGKILRIDVSDPAAGEPYTIPADNPFVDEPGARPEILHYGLRNPFRASVDAETGDLWIGDVGQGAWEEVDVARGGASGLDFGWRRWEGRHCYNPSTDCSPDGVTMPVTEYGHGLGCSVIGGVVYHGEAIPSLRGAYLFADYCSGTLWAIDGGLDSAQEPVTLLETGSGISAIGIDEAGEVLLTLHRDGSLVRLVPGS